MRRQTDKLLLLALISTTGCSTLDRRESFDDVQREVSNRIGKRVVWFQDAGEDEKVAHALASLVEGDITVEGAVQVALLCHRGLQAIYEDVGIAQADLVEAGLLRNPVFEAEFRLPGRPVNPYELHIVQDFIDVFFIPMRRRVSLAALEAQKLRVANAVLEHATETRRTFYRLQAAEQLVDLLGSVSSITEASALLAERQQQAGNLSDLDLANEQALHEQSKVELALAEVEALEERERLNELMGLAGSEAASWRVVPRLPDPPPYEGDAGELELQAVSQRLDLLAVVHEIESQSQALGLTRTSAVIPTLETGGHIEREPEGSATWGPSVGVALPIFNWGQPAIARSMAKLRQSRQKYHALGVKVQAEVRSAHHRMVGAGKVAEQYKSVLLPLRGKIVDESQLHYNAMQIGPSQLLQAKQAELEAGSHYVEALKSYWIAFADLERAVGGRVDLASASQAQATDVPPHGESSSHGEHR